MNQKITAKPAAASVRHRTVLLLTGALVLPLQAVPALAARTTTQNSDIPIPATPAIVQAADPTADAVQPAAPQPDAQTDGQSNEHVRATILPGSEPMPAVAQPASKPPRPGDISLNFPGADVSVVAKAVLGELLHVNYAIAGGVSGRVTLVTGRPVAKSSLLSLFEAALAQGGFGLVPVAGGYEIQAAAAARAPIASETTGFGSEVITLRFINPEEVRKVLDPVLPGIVTATDAPGGTITIAGTTGQRSSARDLLRQFDVDWLRNTSFALYVPQKSDARLITPELDKLINASDSPTHGLVRLIAMENLNGILAISAQPQYLIDVKRWVEILDREGESNERKLFVYRVQNGRAKDLTRTINAAYGMSGGNDSGGSGDSASRSGGGSASDPFGDNANSNNNTNGGNGGQYGGGQYNGGNGGQSNGGNGGQGRSYGAKSSASGGNGGDSGGGNGNGSSTRITADEVNNAIIVFGNPREFAIVEEALRKLDVAPQQVLIEAAITEVGLTDDTSYGVQWNYSNNGSSVGYLGAGSTSAGPAAVPAGTALSGFSYAYTGTNIAATLNAMQAHTKIKVVSAPKLLVLNNQTAALQVGDEVPVSSGSTTNLSGANITNAIEYKDTGVILKITPRVNASGMVQLDVSQEVSEISSAVTSTQTENASPTISTRRIATTVAVQDGQVVALGGLFRDNRTIVKSGVPVLSQIPLLGGLFGHRQQKDDRTELIVLLKPHVLSNPDDARAVTDELRSKLRTLEPFRSHGRMP